MAFLRLAALAVPFFFAAPSLSLAEDPCRANPTPGCVLDLARAELDGFATAKTPPASLLWGTDASSGFERDEAMRIIFDVYSDVAAGYASAGEPAKAQEALSAIEDPAEIATRLDKVIYSGGSRLDPAWLRETLAATTKVTFPFGKAGDYFDDYEWQKLLAFAWDRDFSDVVKDNMNRATAYAASPAFAALVAGEKDSIRISLLAAALLVGDIPAAEALLAAIEDAGQAEYGRMKLGARLAKSGNISAALKYANDMDPVRRSEILSALVAEALQRSDIKAAEKWFGQISEDFARELIVAQAVSYGELPEAEALARKLPLGSQSRIQVAILHQYIDRGQLSLAAAEAERIDEVGERSVGFAVLAIAAAKAGNLDLVVRAEDEIQRMREFKVDAGQIADSEIALLFAYEILGKTALVKARLDSVESDIKALNAESYPDNPAAAVGAPEEQVRLYIEFAGALFAAGHSERAQETLGAVFGKDPESQGDLVFATTEAAGIAYGVTTPALGCDGVRAALAKIDELSLPIDRAMMLSHLARSMQLVPRNF